MIRIERSEIRTEPSRLRQFCAWSRKSRQGNTGYAGEPPWQGNLPIAERTNRVTLLWAGPLLEDVTGEEVSQKQAGMAQQMRLFVIGAVNMKTGRAGARESWTGFCVWHWRMSRAVTCR